MFWFGLDFVVPRWVVIAEFGFWFVGCWGVCFVAFGCFEFCLCLIHLGSRWFDWFCCFDFVGLFCILGWRLLCSVCLGGWFDVVCGIYFFICFFAGLVFWWFVCCLLLCLCCCFDLATCCVLVFCFADFGGLFAFGFCSV